MTHNLFAGGNLHHLMADEDKKTSTKKLILVSLASALFAVLMCVSIGKFVSKDTKLDPSNASPVANEKNLAQPSSPALNQKDVVAEQCGAQAMAASLEAPKLMKRDKTVLLAVLGVLSLVAISVFSVNFYSWYREVGSKGHVYFSLDFIIFLASAVIAWVLFMVLAMSSSSVRGLLNSYNQHGNMLLFVSALLIISLVRFFLAQVAVYLIPRHCADPQPDAVNQA